jgi:ubiquinone/menaquinone biosynthesis C-methylase UbiE
VAAHVVALAGPAHGERVLDVACGTGNAALLAARLGAEATTGTRWSAPSCAPQPP